MTTTRNTVILAAAFWSCALPLHANGWGEPHLSIIPRTEAEAARIAAVTAPTTRFDAPEPFETHPAGKATKFDALNRNAFSFASANMSFERELDFKVGNGFFRKLWVTAPASTVSSDGLGPIYNARACQRCHIKDGRGHPPEDGDDAGVSMFLRVSIPDEVSGLNAEALSYLANVPEPTYGTQIQDKSIAGVPAEGRMQVTYEPEVVTLGDGTQVTLRKPTYQLGDPAYGPLHPQARLSPRVAPQMIGLGLLEAIPEADIMALADPEDANGDGISGKANRVWSEEYQQWMLGRFGLKAGAPTIRAQSAGAFSGDMGLSTPLHPDAWGECSAVQTDCRAAPDGSDAPEHVEVSAQVLDLVTFYSRNLAVPARRDLDAPQVLRGKQLFSDAGCQSCHRPKFVTHRLTDQPEQSFQLIWPYTDMLLHDMGEGLADNRREWLADGREWRTPPLWGIGMTKTVSEHSFFLHDGRARNMLEAILWHGGEAEAARETVRQMPAVDRAALIAFLESL
ncbi:thiol oxidoreductase [Actibacterium mucosum KCTC 23349]|uniref:Thiol oxidoreductase n=1 Tax=Actibacterium mucosum KCTC 23349 TaxID=1454373 RepID=A0A037ZFI9_9RHOB|nr:di-heme oxidoredictase family protein [Actibacterium mucosum]KAJ54363.1 thiol oxidoreductase [Actibacterium mucosum KCTC 23349]